MSRRLLATLITLAAAIAALIAVPAVALAGDPCFHAFDNRPAPSSGATSQVALGDCVFTPTVTRVPVGATVTWTNTSFQAHEIVGSNVTWGAHGKLLQPGDSIGWTFETAGVYGYSCMIHPGMTGVVVVAEASGTADAAGDVAAASSSDAAESDAEANDGQPALAAVGIGAGAGGLGLGLLLAAFLRRNRAASA